MHDKTEYTYEMYSNESLGEMELNCHRLFDMSFGINSNIIHFSQCQFLAEIDERVINAGLY